MYDVRLLVVRVLLKFKVKNNPIVNYFLMGGLPSISSYRSEVAAAILQVLKFLILHIIIINISACRLV